MSVLVTKEQLGSALTAVDARFLKNVTIKQQATAETGYLATYQLFANTGSGSETAFGAKINIPKDYLVKNAEVKTVTTADDPVTGYEVGDKYIDFTINTVDGTGNTSHLYILFKDLLVPYTEGNGIDISASNVVSIVIDNTSVGGLTVGANGLKLAAATPDTYSGGTKTADGVSGAMSSADKYKLDNADVTPYTGTGAIDITNHVVSVGAATTSAAGTMSAADKAKLDDADVTAYTAGNGIDITSHEVSAVVDSSNANGLSVGASGLALAAATSSAAGAMSASDKSKLDNADVTAYTAGNGIDITSHSVAAVVDSSNANGLAVGSSGLSMGTVSASTSGSGGSNGAMLATDKEKLDGMTIASDSEITSLINSIFA